MPINPVHFAHGICDEFLRYLFSAFPLTDPDLAKQARKNLKGKSSLDIPLVQGPFVSLSEAFAKGESVQAMADQGLLHPIMPGLIGYPSMWLHQQQVFEAVKAGRHVLVATGTGSGKTESFLYPIVDDLLRQRDQGITRGDHGDPRLPDERPGQRPARPPAGHARRHGHHLRPVGRHHPGERGGCLGGPIRRLRPSQPTWPPASSGARRPRPRTGPCGRWHRPRSAAPRRTSDDRKPRILLTNYRQLEILTTRNPDLALFAEAPLKYLVFDEAHTYGGATGAEVACLIRRVRALAGKTPDEVICIGTSATLSDPTKQDKDNDETARRFASRFFGVDADKVTLVGRVLRQAGVAAAALSPDRPPRRRDGSARAGSWRRSPSRSTSRAIKDVVEELTGQIFEPGEDWREALFDHLVTNEYVFQTTQVLKFPSG